MTGPQIFGKYWGDSSIHIFSTFWYWLNMAFYGNTPYSFPVYSPWSMVTRSTLGDFLVCCPFLLISRGELGNI